MHERYGRLSWGQLVEPAIALATEGFGATHGYRNFAADNRVRLAADPRSAKVFLDHALAVNFQEVVHSAGAVER
jgi:gamma-glutamyltranspeptidase